ncbi:hypothetical protein OSB04_020359 [Centaurea solstitialis]|uniref:Uncharacterized protein n=1 Tax=Centaurea solstitialis TaxID=347529 RepID=A0AA38T5H5_9ASTR|nr:hypothetical protein OSB04_020359 [Centaurea solstitialis]
MLMLTTMVNPTTTTPMPNTMANHVEGPKTFSGLDFNRLLFKLVNKRLTFNMRARWRLGRALGVFISKVQTKYAGSKKHDVARFLKFKMIDSKILMSQVQNLQVILHVILAEWMTTGETFQVATMIEKLQPSWIDFENYLKHKRTKMFVDYLVVPHDAFSVVLTFTVKNEFSFELFLF